MAHEIIESSLAFLKNIRDTRQREAEEAQQNPFLAKALEREKYEGHRLAIFARTIALIVLAFLVPILVR